ncbi:hypothetical protein AB0910_09520 [Streptomyces sp. NPDC047002]|uniref:hypothetical protein n=1 Tax=Streptomyces sp. NPDC047002 TaxID=3155475 RepID=UPI003451724B
MCRRSDSASRGPRAAAVDLARTYELTAHALGTPPSWHRPPCGVLTTPALLSCRALGTRPVPWTAWGADWRRGATPQPVHDTVVTSLRGGGTVLLHDSDRTSAPGSWRVAVGAPPRLLRTCAQRVPAGGAAARAHGPDPVLRGGPGARGK